MSVPVSRPRSLPSNGTLPGAAYHSDHVYDLEREKIFHGSWICVGRDEQLADPGSYRVVDLAGESILLTRDADGTVHAFYNVCRHRGSPLAEGCGSVRKVLKCPYHAWSYGLDGRLRGTPNVHEDDEFRRADHGLLRIAIESWGGFLFVCLSEPRRTLQEHLAKDSGAPLHCERYHPERLRIGHSLRYEVEANWKIICENFRECLHCPTVHPELVALVPLFGTGEARAADGGSTVLADGAETFAVDGRSGLPHLPGLDPNDQGVYNAAGAFPNLLLNFLADSVVYYLMFPDGPARTIVEAHFLFAPETIAEAAFDPQPVVDFWDLLSLQDWGVCERTQPAMSSRAYVNGGVCPPADVWVRDFAEEYLRLTGDLPVGT
ncbi:MAG: glycine betaine catabolism [Gaiellales bacterium]|nr:glycine betaine catabolism [Gaiellales bacterium]